VPLVRDAVAAADGDPPADGARSERQKLPGTGALEVPEARQLARLVQDDRVAVRLGGLPQQRDRQQLHRLLYICIYRLVESSLQLVSIQSINAISPGVVSLL
jgi:hypothetical protein